MTKNEHIDKTDLAISELVREKHDLQKAYNYYNGIRDKEQFQYLEENFGIGNPTSVEFTPLLKKHVDALVGEFLGTPILPKITCKDSETIANISREKQLKITQEIYKFLNENLSNFILKTMKQEEDQNVKQQLDTLIRQLDQSFISQYEIAAQNVIDYLMQSRHTDIITKLRQLLIDLLVTGYTFFKVKSSLNETNVEIEVLNPLDTFIDRNFDSPYVKDSYRAVVRYYMTKNQILSKYKLSKSEKEKITESWESAGEYHSTYIDSCKIITYNEASDNDRNMNLIPVYEVEWLETDSNGVMHRHSTVRISNDIYIINDIDKDVVRSKDNYNYCNLSINGVYFLNRTQQPYSLILKCVHLQD